MRGRGKYSTLLNQHTDHLYSVGRGEQITSDAVEPTVHGADNEMACPTRWP